MTQLIHNKSNTYGALSEQRAVLQRLRIRLTAHLRTTGDRDHAHRLVQAYLDQYRPDITHRECFTDFQTAVRFISELIPDWSIRHIRMINDVYHQVQLYCDRESYDCKYIAIDLTFPLIVAAITAHMLDIVAEIEKIKSDPKKPG